MLIAPEGKNTRPTADRAKESLFSILTPQVKGARFLDIFCGSGAIGIEALSRGAREAVFVDSASPAMRAVNENLAKTKLMQAEVIAATAKVAISRLAGARQFDIIFLDPPYDSSLLSQTLREIVAANLLADGGAIIAETDSSHSHVEMEEKAEHAQLCLTETRVYGRTKFLFFHKVVA